MRFLRALWLELVLVLAIGAGLAFGPEILSAAQDSTVAGSGGSVLGDLYDALVGPVFLPLVISLFTYLANQFAVFRDRSNGVKRVLILAVPAVLAYAANRFGVDISTVSTAASSVLAIIGYHVAQLKSPRPV